MLIPCKQIAAVIEERMKRDAADLKSRGKVPCLKTLLIGNASDQMSFVAIKKKKAASLSVDFKFIHKEKTPMYEEFMRLVKSEANNPETTGMIIQLPLPGSLVSASVYNFIPLVKEIEGHRPKSPFMPPIGLATLTALKYVYTKSLEYDDVIVTEKDAGFFHKALKGKKVVLIGRGLTGGNPIAKTLSHMQINFLNIFSGTSKAASEAFIKEADVVITAVGRKVITPDMIKPGAILLNVGLRGENGKLKGDYDEQEIADVAGAYTGTPGGIGPIDVLYLYRNLLDATALQ
jgi:methylenetetrahydrofolate dehydrogenase (NADP+)/methenyltetrahydrofolate cyclohydrolase